MTKTHHPDGPQSIFGHVYARPGWGFDRCKPPWLHTADATYPQPFDLNMIWKASSNQEWLTRAASEPQLVFTLQKHSRNKNLSRRTGSNITYAQPCIGMAKSDLRCLMWSARIFWSPHWIGLYLVCCRGTNRYRMVVCTRLTGGHLWSLSNNR